MLDNECPKNIGLKIFYRKMIKQLILWTVFYIFYKNYVKTFLIWFINNGKC